MQGLAFLTDAQDADGTWCEPEPTGTGLWPHGAVRYDLYPICYPLRALSQWAVAVEPYTADEAAPQLRVVCGAT